MNTLKGLRAIVTSGPTHEPLDPVRFLGNRSSGRQGHAIAEALRDAGAEVTLVSGPVSIADPKGMNIIKVTTAREMLTACTSALPADIFVGAAAVADWRPQTVSRQKIKKSGTLPPTIALIENVDILSTVGHLKTKRPRLVIGFAAETHHLLKYADQKRRAKKADWMVANDVSDGKIFDADTTKVLWITGTHRETWTGTKHAIAQQLTRKILSSWT